MQLFVPVAFTIALYSNIFIQEVTPTILPQRIDQKQTGDYNIHLHLKDFHIIALLGNVAGDDYEYDYEVPEEYLDIPSATLNATSTATPASTVTTGGPSAIEITPKIISSTIKPITEKVDPIASDDQIKVERKNITNHFYYTLGGKIPVAILEENSDQEKRKLKKTR